MIEQPIVEEMSSAPRSKRTWLIIAFALLDETYEQKRLCLEEYQRKRRALLEKAKGLT